MKRDVLIVSDDKEGILLTTAGGVRLEFIEISSKFKIERARPTESQQSQA